MAEKRFYWIKLKTDFFNQEAIEFLMSQENGSEYVVLYQMLCLKTANNNGEMLSRINELIVPYDVQKIVRDTKFFDTDTVIVALELFKKLGLIYEQDDNTLRISNFDEMVGSECASAKRVREFRKRKALPSNNLALPGNKNVTQEYRDKSIDNKKENIKRKSDKTNQKELKAEFERLWKLYPRKQGKQLALQKFLKAVSDGVEIKDIENGIIAYNDYLKAKGTEEQYIKIASTWFNQRCWQDDYTITENSSVSRSRKNKVEIATHTYNFADLEKQKLKGV